VAHLLVMHMPSTRSRSPEFAHLLPRFYCRGELLTDEDVRRVQGAKFCPARYAAAAALLKELADRAAERGRQEPLEKEELRPVFCL
jgi:hypothetical protein